MSDQKVSEQKMSDEVLNDKTEIILVSKDGQKISVLRSSILMSGIVNFHHIYIFLGLIKSILEETEDEDDDDITIPVPNVEDKPLKKVIEYCNEHWNNHADEIMKPLNGKLDTLISEFDAAYLVMNESLLVELIMAANYLDIKDLLDLTCASTADMMKGKSPEEIREMFGIENDFTKEEEDKIKEENKWCMQC